MVKELPINQIICGDCVEVMKSWPDECIDLTVTSPPYGNLRDYRGYTFDFESIARELYRITKPGGVVVWVVGDTTVNGSETGTSFRQALYFKDVCGFNLHDTMIYQKDACPFPERNRYYQSFEYMFVLSKGKPKTVNLIADKLNRKYGQKVAPSTQRQPDGKTVKSWANKTDPTRTVKKYGVRGNVWKYSPGYSKSTKDKYAYQHPAMFPEQLAADHIVSWSNPGDIVLDPMCGSGTTCKMALKLGRRFIGIDIAEEYCEISRKRVEAEKERQKFQIIPSSELS
jgi:DNA modification methylase